MGILGAIIAAWASGGFLAFLLEFCVGKAFDALPRLLKKILGEE